MKPTGLLAYRHFQRRYHSYRHIARVYRSAAAAYKTFRLLFLFHLPHGAKAPIFAAIVPRYIYNAFHLFVAHARHILIFAMSAAAKRRFVYYFAHYFSRYISLIRADFQLRSIILPFADEVAFIAVERYF